MRRALAEYRNLGIRDNVGFFLEVLDDAEFAAGRFDTGYIDRWLAARSRIPSRPIPEADRDLALIACALVHARGRRAGGPAGNSGAASRWKRAGRERQMGGGPRR
jgi:acetyl/propionyl-CoA carboxylase alpha subunit